MKYLVDSNIIIYHLNGDNVATDFLRQNIALCCISRMTFIEVLSFDFTQEEEKQIIDLLNNFKIIDTNDAIAMQCIKNRKIKKIKLADNIIASTAQVNDLVIVTRNIKDFNKIDVEMLNIFNKTKDEK